MRRVNCSVLGIWAGVILLAAVAVLLPLREYAVNGVISAEEQIGMVLEDYLFTVRQSEEFSEDDYYALLKSLHDVPLNPEIEVMVISLRESGSELPITNTAAAVRPGVMMCERGHLFYGHEGDSCTVCRKTEFFGDSYSYVTYSGELLDNGYTFTGGECVTVMAVISDDDPLIRLASLFSPSGYTKKIIRSTII